MFSKAGAMSVYIVPVLCLMWNFMLFIFLSVIYSLNTHNYTILWIDYKLSEAEMYFYATFYDNIL